MTHSFKSQEVFESVMRQKDKRNARTEGCAQHTLELKPLLRPLRIIVAQWKSFFFCQIKKTGNEIDTDGRRFFRRPSLGFSPRKCLMRNIQAHFTQEPQGSFKSFIIFYYICSSKFSRNILECNSGHFTYDLINGSSARFEY